MIIAIFIIKCKRILQQYIFICYNELHFTFYDTHLQMDHFIDPLL